MSVCTRVSCVCGRARTCVCVCPLQIIVVSSVATLFLPDDVNVPGLSQVKLMKSFRVLRLFRRITALKKLLHALAAALPVRYA